MRTCRLNSIFLWTLILSVFIITPSFADDNLKENTDVALTTPLSNTLPFAQNFTIPNDGISVEERITDCTARNKFTDDNYIASSLYADDEARQDTISICPDNAWQQVKAVFTNADIATDDTLFAYDGNLAALRNNTAAFIGKGTGVGVSSLFGGWVIANCSPAINPSGCLTFVFTTNGERTKGTGWESWVSCNDRGLTLTPPIISNTKLACEETSKLVTIGAAAVSATCGTIANDTTNVQIINTSGQVCLNTMLSKNQGMSINQEFGIGAYLITYTLKSDPTKTVSTTFAITEPNLVCNDQLFVPLGSACMVTVTPDMILENPCDTIQDTLYYEIRIKDSAGRLIASGTGRAGDYPTLSKAQVNGCNNLFQVEITRVYYDGLNLPFCNNGRQASTCTTNITFADNTPPIFTQAPSADTIFACEPNLSEEGLMLTRPYAVDNCVDASVTFGGARLINQEENCEETAYIVTWVAADNCGNTTNLRDTVRVMRPGIDKIVKVPDAILSCGEDDRSTAFDLNRTGTPGLEVGVQRNGVFIPTDTVSLSVDEYICRYILTKTDQQFNSTCGDKFFRYWTLVDWCSDIGIMRIDTQAIFFKDTIAPTINCFKFETLETAERISLPNFECTKELFFLPPSASDNCDSRPTVSTFTVEQLENGSWWKVANNLDQAGGLPKGTYRVGYRAEDECFEQVKEDSCFRYFVLEDLVKPSAVCQDRLTVSLANDFARIRATDIDAGSWDACGVESILVRRQVCGQPDIWQGAVNNYVRERLDNKLDPTGWSDFVDFSCCDAGQTVTVQLLVIDNNGNYNFCWMEVIPEDKVNPICANLPNQWDYCDNFHNGELGAVTDTDGDRTFDNTEWLPLEGDLADLYNDKYGEPLASCVDNLSCQTLNIEQQYQLIDQECGVYQAKRRYRVRDFTGNVSGWAEQFISIDYRPDWEITLPVDWEGTCGDGVPTAELLIENGACDLLAYESYDQRFDVVNDACFQVIRTYHIINWCKYNAGDTPLNLNRIANAQGDVVNQQTITSAQYTNNAYFTYTQILKVNDTEAPIVSVADVTDCIEKQNSCSIYKTFSATATDCNQASSESLDFYWEVAENDVIRGSGHDATFNWAVAPNITYKVKWQVSDKCGNSTWVEKSYTFRDCFKPTAYCLSGLALELGSTQEVAIWATDFDVNSEDNCTDKDNLNFRIWHSSLAADAPTNIEGVLALPTSISLNCEYIGDQPVQVYVIDEAGNFDFCVTNMQVQDNMGVCPSSGGSVAGKIYTEFGLAVQEVEVHVENIDNTVMMTQANGNYAFDVQGSANYTILPKKDTDNLNGISTFDLVKITKHILDKERFTSPYQYIAADINASGSITTFDVIQLRKLILNLSTEFPDDNTSWRFVDASYDFTSDNPVAESFPEHIEVNNLTGTLPDLDFIAVKVGDVNGSASASALVVAENRSKEGEMIVEITDRPVVEGELVEVAFAAKDFKNIEGYQFTLNFEGLELIDFASGVATEANIGFTLKDRGYLTTSWNKTNTQPNDNTADLFRLTFRVTTSGSLLSLLDINSDFTSSEAYRNDGSLLGVALQPQRSAALYPTFGLQQNTPNPFTNSTLIGFELPSAANVELKIIDMQGQVVQTKQGAFTKGQNQLEVQATDLPNGTYYYQLVTPFGVEAKKMIVLR